MALSSLQQLVRMGQYIQINGLEEANSLRRSGSGFDDFDSSWFVEVGLAYWGFWRSASALAWS